MPFGKKPPLGQRIKGALSKVFAVAALVGAPIAGTGYYHYGTVQEQEVKVTSIDKGEFLGWDYLTYQSQYAPGESFRTDKGDFNNVSSLFHLKSDNDAKEIQNDVEVGKIFRVKSYGGWFGDPNVLDVTEVTPEEIKERLAAEERAKAEELALQQQELENQQGEGRTPPVVVQPGAPAQPQPTALSGATSEVIITAHGFDVKLTVPTEVVDKIKVDEIKKTEPIRIVQPPTPPAPGS